MYAHLSLFESKQIYVIKGPLFPILNRSTSIHKNNSALVVSIVLQKHYFTKFTVFVRFLKKTQLISRVLVRSLKIAQFYALQMFKKKQNLTHPKAAKLATLEVIDYKTFHGINTCRPTYMTAYIRLYSKVLWYMSPAWRDTTPTQVFVHVALLTKLST